MKAGTENKTKLYIAIMLGIVAVLTVAWEMIPSAPTTPRPVGPTSEKAKPSHIEALDPRLRLDLLASSEEVKYEGKGKNIFRSPSEAVVIPNVRVSPLLDQHLEAPKVYIPPPPPPITLKYFGITNAKGEKPKAFLSQGEDVWIAHEGDVVNRHYKIVRISPREVEVEDLLNNNRQNIPLTQG